MKNVLLRSLARCCSPTVEGSLNEIHRSANGRPTFSYSDFEGPLCTAINLSLTDSQIQESMVRKYKNRLVSPQSSVKIHELMTSKLILARNWCQDQGIVLAGVPCEMEKSAINENRSLVYAPSMVCGSSPTRIFVNSFWNQGFVTGEALRLFITIAANAHHRTGYGKNAEAKVVSFEKNKKSRDDVVRVIDFETVTLMSEEEVSHHLSIFSEAYRQFDAQQRAKAAL